MKLVLPAAIGAAFFVSACSGDLTAPQREALMAEAVFLVDELSDGELAAPELTDAQRAVLSSACRLGPVFAPDEFEAIAFTCDLLELG